MRLARPLLCVLALATVIALAIVSPAEADDSLVWTVFAAGSGHVFLAPSDGSAPTPGAVGTLDASSDYPYGAAPDPAANRLYWANYFSGAISWVNLDGSGSGDLDITGATPNAPSGLVVDHADGLVYWTNFDGNSISWAHLDGSGGGQLATGSATVDEPVGPAIDQANHRIYWANRGTSSTISWANLDGSGGGDLDTTGGEINNPQGVVIDPDHGRVYWGNENSGIGYASLAGGSGGFLETAGATRNTPYLGALDPATGQLYWSNWDVGGISVAQADGSGDGHDLYPTPADAVGPALVTAPVPDQPPVLTGGSLSGTTLSCSVATWKDDLLGNKVYRAPHAFGYSWLRNGSPVAGANGPTLKTTAGGTYVCRMTATNFAGSTTQTSATHTVIGPPDTRITRARTHRSHHRATFRFQAVGDGGSFQCELKGPHRTAVYRGCRAPRTYRHLRRGHYVFLVRAIGPAGKDPTPARHRFRIH